MRNNSKIYNSAFKSEFDSIFASFPKIKNETEYLAYKKFLSCFMRGGEIGEYERRQALYYYMKYKGWGNEEEKDYINVTFPSMPSNNDTYNRVLNNLCQVYTIEPDREFATSESNKETINDILNEVRFNTVMQDIHKVVKATGECAIRPRVRNGKLNLQVLKPDQYVAIKDDYGKVVEFYRPYKKIITQNNEDIEEIRVEYWDDKVYKELDASGKAKEFVIEFKKYNIDTEQYDITSVESMFEYQHNLGIMPYYVVNFSNNDNDGTDDALDFYEIAKLQLDSNLLDVLSAENYIYSAFSFIIAVNLDINKDTRISPGRIFNANPIKDFEGEKIPPYFDINTPETFFDRFQELKENMIKSGMKNAGLPTSLVDNNPGLVASGEALKQDRKELNEIRQQDIAYLRYYDKAIIKHILKVFNNDSASRYKGKLNFDFEIYIDYKEDTMHEDFADKKERLEYYISKGLITPLSFYRQLTGDDTASSDDDAINEMKKNIEIFKNLFEANNAENNTGDAAEAESNPSNAGTEEATDRIDEQDSGN